MKEKRNLLGISMTVMAISMAISCFSAEEKVELRLRLEKGQSYKMRIVQDLKISQKIQEKQQDMTQKRETEDTYTVEDVHADGTAVVKVTYQRIFFKQESLMGENRMEMEYDSSDPSKSVGPLAVYGAIVGQSFTITVTPGGHVEDIKGADVLMERIGKKLNELPEGPMRDNMEVGLRMQYGEEALREGTENSFNMYPDKPIGIGDSWQKRIVISYGFPIIANTIFTLKERKDGIAAADVFSVVQPNRAAGPMEMGPAKLHYNISGTATGSIEMRESTGWIVNSRQTLKLSGKIKVENPQIPQPMSLPISIKGTITQELFE